MFSPYPDVISYPDLERAVLAFWREKDVFGRSVTVRDGAPRFTFYEGPPTVNGRPGIHHVMSRTLKDLVCRYKTLDGYQVQRKAGWDTHGLPVEIALEKELAFEQKSDIERYGVAAFNAKARELVMQHIDMREGWRTLTERMGYWINLDDAYITCTNDYIESVWWALSEFHRRGLVYKGFKIVPQCPHCETPLSSHELALGYADVLDMNVYVLFRCADEDASFLVWTTTPWTLISNVALAVHPDTTYVRVRTAAHGTVYLAKERLSVLAEPYDILDECVGSTLVGRKYQRLFDDVPVDKPAFYVVAGDFVTTEDGSGIVHIAPAFGVDDYEILKKYDLPFVNPVTPGGRFTEAVPSFAGRLVKTITFATHREEGVDRDVIAALKRAGRIYRSSKDYAHSYPHCWRCDNPLIYYARDSWYIRTTAFASRMIELNGEIGWCPPEVGSGRFGNWLEENKDWSLSRDRYWGTPLPIWVAENGSDAFCVGSVEELLTGFIETDAGRRSPTREEIDLHKPFVDTVLFEREGRIYRRTPELIDVWFDSGAMPFAQYHYPFENREYFADRFPADFICEGIDQTRGWFYTLHAIAAALFDRPAFRNVIVNELILDKSGQKMSKSRGNAVDPFQVIGRYGADATRWYLVVNSPPWRPTSFNEADIEGVQKNAFRALVNTYQFFALYANIDGFTGADARMPVDRRPEIDRWILTELGALARDYHAAMRAYDVTQAARAVSAFVVDQLSNWYVRRNRRRFWKGERSDDKLAAYQTLHECLVAVTQYMAPFAPFLADDLYRRLTVDMPGAEESVHLTRFLEPEPVDEGLKEKMHHAQRVVSVARMLREKTRLKTRQPLSRMLIATHDPLLIEDVRAMETVILDETNIRALEIVDSDSELVKKKVRPNFKSIGPKFGTAVNAVADRMRRLSPTEISALEERGSLEIDVNGSAVTITLDDGDVLHEDIQGWTIGKDRDIVVALDTNMTQELLNEGLAREFVNRIQNLRKEKGFEVVDRIAILYQSPDARMIEAITVMEEYIKRETLAVKLLQAEIPDSHATDLRVNDLPCRVFVTNAVIG